MDIKVTTAQRDREIETGCGFNSNNIFAYFIDREYKSFGRGPFEKMSTLLAHLGPPDQHKNAMDHKWVVESLTQIVFQERKTSIVGWVDKPNFRNIVRVCNPKVEGWNLYLSTFFYCKYVYELSCWYWTSYSLGFADFLPNLFSDLQRPQRYANENKWILNLWLVAPKWSWY